MPQLTWLGDTQAKRAASAVPYRLLENISQHGDAAANWLIQGDNLDALKALLPFYAGRVKCIFIDPPYNTKSAFEHYDDNLEHSQWLSMMLPRLELLRDLLSEDGSIWVTIDDNEAHYLKVLMDEVFGRGNFVANVVWEKSDSPKMDSQYFSSRHDHLIVFSKAINRFVLGKIIDVPQDHYNRTDENGRRYYTKPLRAMGSGEDTREARPSMFYPLEAPDGSSVFPMKPDGTEGRWRWSPDKVASDADRIEWVKGKAGWSAYYRIYEDSSAGRPPETIWAHTIAGSNRTSKAEVKAIFGNETTFTTPKPEALLAQILNIATHPNDLVLDSFLGSGTTAAVAHKMGRRWIGIEMGEHARTHCLPRLQKVVEGEPGGISQAVNWQGGGGFRFMQLGAPVFMQDGRIHPDIRFATLAAYVWFLQTGAPHDSGVFNSPLLGVAGGDNRAEGGADGENAVAVVLLFNGILGDRRANGGNVLTSPLWTYLQSLCPGHKGRWVIVGEASRMTEARRRELKISFQQIPYDIRMR